MAYTDIQCVKLRPRRRLPNKLQQLSTANQLGCDDNDDNDTRAILHNSLEKELDQDKECLG